MDNSADDRHTADLSDPTAMRPAAPGRSSDVPTDARVRHLYTGRENYSIYMNVVTDRLVRDGLFMVNNIAINTADNRGNL